ncbi:MAG: Carbohydrate-binding family, partial [Burkholderiales bacterium]|nr:Carbohydrate-binding family [Burkholderiales bacterium]
LLVSSCTIAYAVEIGNNSPEVTQPLIFSPYKDVGVNMNWDSKSPNYMVMSTKLTGDKSLANLVDALPSQVKTVSWAFATGECGNEMWAGIDAPAFAAKNIVKFTAKNTNYIVSTGGAAGKFTCSTPQGMKAFIDRYNSSSMAGLDFDIEGYKLSRDEREKLIETIAYAKTQYPNLRISFTLATLADSSGSGAGLNSEGDAVVTYAKSLGLDFYVNLMTMDYGNQASKYICVVNPQTGQCDMGQSAIQAVKNLNAKYGIPYNRIEVTPLIGEADVPNEVFTLDDATILKNYAQANGLAAIHYWSFDRDTPCAPGPDDKTICNGVPPGGSVKPLSYTFALAPQ